MASDGDFVQIEKLNTAGLGHTDNPLPFFRRKSFNELSDFYNRIINGCEIGLIEGLPGTGKSCTLWYKILSLSKKEKKSTLWIHFRRHGKVSAFVKVNAGGKCDMLTNARFSDIKLLFSNIPRKMCLCSMVPITTSLLTVSRRSKFGR